jgi:hypothetical protein
VCQGFWNPLWKLLLSPSKMTLVCILSYSWIIFLSYQFHVSLYFSIPVEECSYYRHIMFLVHIESILPSHLSCLTMFKGSFTSNHPSIVLLVFIYVSVHTHLIHNITSLSCVSFVLMMGDTSWPSFNESFLVYFNTLSRN